MGVEGQSHVWVAEHSGLGKRVAVKLMGRTLSRNSTALHRFQREAEVAARQVRNPYVAQILEHGLTQSGMPYLVMELLEGEDLAQRVERGPLTPRAAVRMIGQLAKGLSKAHQLGLVHRNLKPANIFLVPAENLDESDTKILDLGLSVRAGLSSMGRTISDAALVVAPQFLSPEQMFGQKDVDYRADIWTLGVVAYFALTGKVPFHEKNIEAFAKLIEEGQFTAATAVNPSLPAAVDAFFAKAFQREPGARFSSATELAEELERALGVEQEERTSRTSYPHPVGQRNSATGPTTGSTKRPVMVSEKEISERIPASVRAEALRATRPPEAITVTAAREKSSSALLIVVLAVVGIGAIVAGVLSLSASPTPAPSTAPGKPGASSNR